MQVSTEVLVVDMSGMNMYSDTLKVPVKLETFLTNISRYDT